MKTKTGQRLTTLALLLTMLLTAPAVAFAAGDAAYYNETSIPICSEPITLTVAGKENSGRDWSQQYLTKYIEEYLGIKLDITTYTNDQWNTQFTLMLSVNDLPDLFVGANSSKSLINGYGYDGFMLDFAEYEQLMPNYTALRQAYPAWGNYQKTTEGNVYGFSRLFPSRIGLATALNTFVKKSWLENVGMDMPTSLDEFYEVLVAFKEQDANGNGDPNDEIPLCIQLGSGRGIRLEWLLKATFGFYTKTIMDVDESGTVFCISTTDAYKDYLKYMNKLYREGLLDPSAFIQTDDERIDKVVNDRAGFFSDYSGLLTAIGGGDGSAYAEYDYLVGLTSPYNDQISVPLGNAGYADGARTFANANTKYPEAIARLVDYFLSDESVLLCDYGVEGVTFDYITDDFGNKVPSFAGYWENSHKSANDYQNTLRLDEAFKLIRTNVLNDIVENASDEMLSKMLYEDPHYTYTAEASFENAMRRADRLLDPYPDLLYTEQESTELSTLSTDIGSYLNMMKASFIMGEQDIDANWGSYLSEVERMGLNRYVEIEQAAYDRLLK